MLMRGDVNKMITEVNKILEGAFKRIQALEDRIMVLEGSEVPLSADAPQVKRGPGRPPGSKNKVNIANKAA